MLSRADIVYNLADVLTTSPVWGTRNMLKTSITRCAWGFTLAAPLDSGGISMNVKHAAIRLAPLVALLVASGAGGKWGR